MKNLDSYLEELCATPANTMGMGNPAAPCPDGEPGSEPIPTAKAKRSQPKRKRKTTDMDEAMLDEAMLFPIKRFFGEIAHVFSKYHVTLVNDEEGTYFEDESGNVLFDITKKYMDPAAWMRTAAYIK